MNESKHLHLVGDDSGAPLGIALSFSPQCYYDISILEGAFLNPCYDWTTENINNEAISNDSKDSEFRNERETRV
ncbi:hypothetical protein EV1_038642 [Malus domestica]